MGVSEGVTVRVKGRGTGKGGLLCDISSSFVEPSLHLLGCVPDRVRVGARVRVGVRIGVSIRVRGGGTSYDFTLHFL